MRNPFTARRPWAVFLLTLLLWPSLAMLFIGRWRLALFYALAEFALAVACAEFYREWFPGTTFLSVLVYMYLALKLICTVHATWLAWKHPFAAPGRWYTRWYTILGIPVAWVGLVVINAYFLFPTYYVPTHSMEPGIGLNDTMFASRLSYRFREPARGEVIAFHLGFQRSIVYVKRIVGIPGDRVQMRGGIVFLNGKPLASTAPGGHCCTEALDGRRYAIRKDHATMVDDTEEFRLPPGQYFVLGDNRSDSLDSRYEEFGLVSRNNIIGPMVLKFYDGPSGRVVFQPVR
jgi:signal peptidase I